VPRAGGSAGLGVHPPLPAQANEQALGRRAVAAASVCEGGSPPPYTGSGAT